MFGIRKQRTQTFMIYYDDDEENDRGKRQKVEKR